MFVPIRHMPKYSSREMLFVLGCLTTCDPGNILQTIKVYFTLNIHRSFSFNLCRLAKAMKSVVR